jgi:putative transposase
VDELGGSRWTALNALGEAERRRALEQFYWLRPVLEEGVPLQRLARERGVPRRTAQRWLQRFQQHGLAGLAHRPRSDRGRPRRIPIELRRLIEGLALRKPPPTVASVHRQACLVAEARAWSAPSYATVYSIVRALDPGLLMLAHDGPKRYADHYELLYRREASRPNEMWQADHTELDLWVLDERGQPARPWLTIVLDDYSRAVAGYAVSLHAPSSIQTALALRQAIWRKGNPHWTVCGIPEVFYNDHGSDFTSEHLEQVAADLHMAVVFSTAGKPRGRGKIERVFGTVNQMFLSDQPGYSPAGAARAQPQLTLPELDRRLRQFLVETYNHRTHTETGVTPRARWEAAGFLPRLPETPEELDLLLLTVAKPRRETQTSLASSLIRMHRPGCSDWTRPAPLETWLLFAAMKDGAPVFYRFAVPGEL